MTRPKLVKVLAMLAVAFSIATLAIQAVTMSQGGEVHWISFSASFIVLLGAGSRLRKSAPAALSVA
jgi:hypothetical protein